MTIKTINNYGTVRLDTRIYSDVFVRPNELNTFYIVIEPDFELDPDAGVYCVNLCNGELYCFEADDMVIPVKFDATASF